MDSLSETQKIDVHFKFKTDQSLWIKSPLAFIQYFPADAIKWLILPAFASDHYVISLICCYHGLQLQFIQFSLSLLFIPVTNVLIVLTACGLIMSACYDCLTLFLFLIGVNWLFAVDWIFKCVRVTGVWRFSFRHKWWWLDLFLISYNSIDFGWSNRPGNDGPLECNHFKHWLSRWFYLDYY